MKKEYPSPLEPSRIADALTMVGIHWLQDPRGVLVAPFRIYDEEELVVVTYAVEGDDDILVIRGALQTTYEPDDYPLVVGLLNSWHNEFRWPTASLDVTKPEARVVASFQAYLPAGVTEAQLAGFAALGTDTVNHFHRWFLEHDHSTRVKAQDTVSAAELEEWFRRTA